MLSFAEQRKPALLVLAVGVVVTLLHIGAQETGERDDLSGSAELCVFTRRRRARNTHAHRLSRRVGHLRRHSALPDQLIQPELIATQLAAHVARGPEAVTCGADRLVRL